MAEEENKNKKAKKAKKNAVRLGKMREGKKINEKGQIEAKEKKLRLRKHGKMRKTARERKRKTEKP